MDCPARLRQLRSALVSNKLDAILISHLPNIRYLCGFTGSAAALLITESKAIFFTDGRYRTQAKQEVKGASIVVSPKSPLLAAADWLALQRRRSALTLGIEPDHLTVAGRDHLKSTLKHRMRSAPPLVERARMVKDESEIRLIKQAVTLGASLFKVACKTVRPGTTELEVAAAMEFEARRSGAEGMSFSTIIASGPRSALIHGRASSAQIPRRGFVVCDFGVVLSGYCSDRTRAVHVGRASAEARALYNAVLEAQLAAIAAVRPGITCAEVDQSARSILRRHKLARWFTHSTGHGLGLEIHESPRLAAGQTQKLEPGMVITVEPGVYVPGKWGVRIEDVVVVTRSGCEVLTPSDKELIEL
jgi:Xaa-Pro aminopeptidase